jgi:hypothetical protein
MGIKVFEVYAQVRINERQVETAAVIGMYQSHAVQGFKQALGGYVVSHELYEILAVAVH